MNQYNKTPTTKSYALSIYLLNKNGLRNLFIFYALLIINIGAHVELTEYNYIKALTGLLFALSTGFSVILISYLSRDYKKTYNNTSKLVKLFMEWYAFIIPVLGFLTYIGAFLYFIFTFNYACLIESSLIIIQLYFSSKATLNFHYKIFGDNNIENGEIK